MVGSKRITCLANGELGRPILSGLFLEQSVSPSFFPLASNFEVDCVGFRNLGKPAWPLSFSAGSRQGKRGRGNLMCVSVWLSIEKSNEWLQKGEILNTEKGLGLKDGGEEQRAGFNGWGSLNFVMRPWGAEVFATASRILSVSSMLLLGDSEDFLGQELTKMPYMYFMRSLSRYFVCFVHFVKVADFMSWRNRWGHTNCFVALGSSSACIPFSDFLLLDTWSPLINLVNNARMFLSPFKTLKRQYIISQGKKNLSSSAKTHAESKGWRGFGKGFAVDFLGAEHLMKLACHEKLTKLKGFISSVTNGLPGMVASVFINTGGGRDDTGNKERLSFGASTNSSSNKRQWTNILLALNVLAFVAQIASKGKLTSWGAKINSLIDRGEIWRFATSSLLHANIGHLMVNCFSLNSVGPVIEGIGGGNRFIAVYVASAFASSATSYMLCRSPAVGASGAIFGLVGSYAMFILRHRHLFKDGKQDLFHIVRVIALNMAIGVLSNGIDNWGHLGGLLGGVAVSWLVGPAWTYQYTRSDGRQVFVDKPPLHYFSNHR